MADNKFIDVATGSIVNADLASGINYVYLDNDTVPGTPTVKVTSDRSTIKLTNQINMGMAYKIGTDVEVVSLSLNLPNFRRDDYERLRARGLAEVQ